MFGLGWFEMLALVVLALLIFGPEKLPQVAQQAGRTIRQLRQMANNAKQDLQSNLGPEFANFDPADLNPKRFVRKHLIDDLEADWNGTSTTTGTLDPPSFEPHYTPPGGDLAYGEIPPYDTEAT